jgi:hypothetical protein
MLHAVLENAGDDFQDANLTAARPAACASVDFPSISMNLVPIILITDV